MVCPSVLLPSSTSPVLSLRADLVRLPSRLLSARFMLPAGLGVVVTCIATQPGVPSSGGSSLRALWVASPRSRHRILLLDLRRLSLPTPHVLQCVILESQLLSVLDSPRVPPCLKTIVVHCSGALARSVPLVVAVFSVIHFFLMLTFTH